MAPEEYAKDTEQWRQSRGEIVKEHTHHGIKYRLNSEERCEWYNCSHNVYNGDYPELD